MGPRVPGAEHPADEGPGPRVKQRPGVALHRWRELRRARRPVDRSSASSPSRHYIGRVVPARLPGTQQRRDADTNLVKASFGANS